MKKKQRCLFNRFAALVAALVMCAALCMPCFASNNASTKKWVVKSEANLTNEQGTTSRYLQLTPYENGSVYAATLRTYFIHQQFSSSSGAYTEYRAMTPVNYPDWWRSAIPLGANSYIAIDKVTLISAKKSGSSYTPSLLSFYLADSTYSFSLSTGLRYSSGEGDMNSPVLTGPLNSYIMTIRDTNTGVSVNAQPVLLRAPGSGTSTALMQNATQVIFAGASYLGKTPTSAGLGFSDVPTLYNLSSDNLVIMVTDQAQSSLYEWRDIVVSAEISFFVDANKLPAGLQVGDEFPADTDAFDQLRDDLIKQFPEASENIENGKATIQGWNDTETVDTDVASTSISVLNALFQNLVGFLFIVSLMVFGAVVLRMLIRKAVDG